MDDLKNDIKKIVPSIPQQYLDHLIECTYLFCIDVEDEYAVDNKCEEIVDDFNKIGTTYTNEPSLNQIKNVSSDIMREIARNNNNTQTQTEAEVKILNHHI